jgi:hypothetical protein
MHQHVLKFTRHIGDVVNMVRDSFHIRLARLSNEEWGKVNLKEESMPLGIILKRLRN